MRAPYAVDSQHLRISASVGVVVVRREDALSSSDILRTADAALYEAKHAGRNRAVIREPSRSR